MSDSDSTKNNPAPSAGECHFVGRGGLKLEHALTTFRGWNDLTGLICADFGCNVGGFTDCLLQHGASRVFAVDTGYGMLDYRLRMDERVIVMERTNALHAAPPPPLHAGPSSETASIDLITADMAWTRQEHVIRAALRWLRPPEEGNQGRPPAIISLVKPHYEADELERRGETPLSATGQRERRHQHHHSRKRMILTPEQSCEVFERVCATFPTLGVKLIEWTPSPILGGKSKGHQGNIEYLVLLTRL